MNILKLWYKILMLSVVSYVDDPENWGGSDDENQDDPENPGTWDDGEKKDDWKSDDPEKKDTPENKYTRWKIAQAKKQAAKEVIEWGSKKTPDPKREMSDKEFDDFIWKLVDEKIQAKGWENDNSSTRVTALEERLQKDDFFNQFKEAGQKYSEYWLSIEPWKWGEILADIEENWFTPEHLILLANADNILWKLKSLPKAPTSTDGGQKVKVDTSKMSMMDRVKNIRAGLGW